MRKPQNANKDDTDGDWLEGGESYTLHVPANPPAEQFWSIAVYSWDTRTLIDGVRNVCRYD
jgi:hypothetical protein